MASLLIEGISDEIRRRLERRASEHGHSVEAEICAILAAATGSERAPDIGAALSELGKRFGGVDLDIARDPSPARAASFD